MPRRCCVPGCKSNHSQKVNERKYITVFCIPKDPVERAKWISVIPNCDVTRITENSAVCILHFDSDSVQSENGKVLEKPDGSVLKVSKKARLKDGACPSIFNASRKTTISSTKNSDPGSEPILTSDDVSNQAISKRKYKELKVIEKRKILECVDRNESSIESIANEFRINVGTVKCVIKNRNQIEAHRKSKQSSSPHTINIVKLDVPVKQKEVEDEVLSWYKIMRNENYYVSPSLLLAKANLTANEKQLNVKYDGSWIKEFETKYDLSISTPKSLVSKAVSTTVEKVDEHKVGRNSSLFTTLAQVTDEEDNEEEENMSFQSPPRVTSRVNKLPLHNLHNNSKAPAGDSSSLSSSSSSSSSSSDSSSSSSSSDDELNQQPKEAVPPVNIPIKSAKRSCAQCGKVNYKSSFFGKAKIYCRKSCFWAAVRAKKSKALSFRPKNISPASASAASGNVTRTEELGSFSWKTYLGRPNFLAAPVVCFKHVALSDSWNEIIINLKIEVENKDCLNYRNFLPTFYWIASVVKTAGFMALLRYEGYDDDKSKDFWINMCTEKVLYVGWCSDNGYPLIPPRSIEKKYSNWKKYLEKRMAKARTIPMDFDFKVKESLDNNIQVGKTLEVVDKNRISCVRVATVNEVMGGRLHLSYKDCEEDRFEDFWCHERSPLIHPVGWAQVIGHDLKATREYARQSLRKTLYREFEPSDATWAMFLPVLNPVTNLKFEEGMKLEAIDPLNLSTICVATVTKVLRNNYLMIGIDGMMAANGSDWFCYHASSPCIFPVGFCETNGIKLTPPRGYKGEFKWNEYLKLTKSTAAPVGLFEKEIPDHGFTEGMHLEAVDLMEPRLICVGVVTKVVGRLLRIHFDGWEEDYDQWCDCESPDLYPVGWCQLVGYRLEPPRTQVCEDLIKKKKKMYVYKGGNRKKKRGPIPGKKLSPKIVPSGILKESLESTPTKQNGSSSSPVSSAQKKSKNSVSGTDLAFRLKSPKDWSASDVVNFLQANNCGAYVQHFEKENIDGAQFLNLTKEKLLSFTGLKVGPSLKIFNLINRLLHK